MVGSFRYKYAEFRQGSGGLQRQRLWVARFRW
jgi:hypothetical protein